MLNNTLKNLKIMRINSKFYIIAWIAVVVLAVLSMLTDKTELYIVTTALMFFQMYVGAVVLITKGIK